MNFRAKSRSKLLRLFSRRNQRFAFFWERGGGGRGADWSHQFNYRRASSPWCVGRASAKSRARIIRERWLELIWRRGASSSTRNQSNARTNIVIARCDDNDRVYAESVIRPGLYLLATTTAPWRSMKAIPRTHTCPIGGIGADFVRWLHHSPRAIFCFARRNWLPSADAESAPCRFNCFGRRIPPLGQRFSSFTYRAAEYAKTRAISLLLHFRIHYHTNVRGASV